MCTLEENGVSFRGVCAKEMNFLKTGTISCVQILNISTPDNSFYG
jgi:hypothetical protein